MSALAKSTLLPDQQKRAELLAAMTPALQQVAQRFDKLHATVTRGFLLTKYDMGMDVKKVLEETVKYGENAVGQLATYFDMSETDLYDLRNLTDIYDRKQVEELALKTMANGKHVTITHVLNISKVKAAKDRQKLWDRVFAESLTSNQLADEVAAGYERTHKRSGGRKPARPTSPVAGAQQIASNVQTINNRFEVWKEAVFDTIDELEPTKIDEVLVVKLEEADAQITELENNITQYHERLRKNLKRAKDVVAKAVENGKEEAKPKKKTKAKGRKKAAA